MNAENDTWLNPELQRTGSVVAGLSRPKAPLGLLERTLERAALIKPLRKKLLFLRPITHPLARVAAVVVLMSMVATAPLTDLDTVDTLGKRIEYSVVGTKNVDRFESLMDNVLAKINTDGYSQNELDAVTGVTNSNPKMTRFKAAKPRLHTGV
jgi:hypothetical protein